MKENKREVSLRRQILFIVLLCWLIPVVMLLTMMIWYLGGAVGSRAEENYSNQLVVHLRMCADRLNSAVEASRLASYDTTIREAWNEYQRDGNYAALYRETRGFLNRQYQSDSRFLYAVFWFSSDPEEMQLTTFNSGLGGVYNQISAWWAQDFEGARTLAADLDTAVGFLERDGRLYLIRNLMDSQYNVIGVLALALYQPYYFEDLSALGGASPVELTLGEGTTLALGGGGPIARDRGVLTGAVEGSGYQLNARAALLDEVRLAPIRSYQVALGVMLALLVPLLLLTVTFFRRKVSTPMEHLMSGAREIESGHLGYQVNYLADTLEFRYLTDSFNHMSGRLRAQFDRLYREEIALRDAQIKALQAHINPHFLNNTLEIINWEARMNGNENVSRMIESLSTVLDAALDRKKSPEVTLAEELRYVDAYLYIITRRFGSRLSVDISIPDGLLDCPVPRLILQPVIENAVEHGIRPNGRGEIGLRAVREGDFLVLEVTNNGGLSPEDEAHIARLLAPDYDASQESSGNIGIANVNLRLRILYGPDCGLTATRGQENLVSARLTIALPGER